MDKNEKLEKILREDNAPEIDINARKRAVNLAMAEFKSAQNEKNQKNSQGISFLSRLMGKSTHERGENPMEQKTKKKFIYGGMATAMVVVLAVGISSDQLRDAVNRYDSTQPTTLPAGSKITQVPGTSDKAVPQGYLDAVEEVNEETLERAIQEGQSAIPVPVAAPETRLEVPEVKEKPDPLLRWRQLQEPDPNRKDKPQIEPVVESDKLKRWRQLQEERVERQLKSRESEVKPVTPQEYELAKQYRDERLAKKGENTKNIAPNDVFDLGENDTFEEFDVTSADVDAAKNSVQKDKIGQDDLVELLPPMESEKSQHVPEITEVEEDPLLRWRRLQEERVERALAAKERFEKFIPNPFKQVSAEPVSTFSSDVDTASYSFVRKTINNGRLPNPSAVRVEEMINYFTYNYPQATDRSQPFQPTVTVTDSPWAEGRKLMHIGIKGYELDKASLRSNLVFLLDVSGSMNSRDKLPLVKSSMKMLLDSLHPDDTVSIVTYAGSTGVVLQPTKARNSTRIINAMNNLRAGGGTAGAAGIELAYQLAEQNFNENAVNRVILATDGDFNVGITDRNELKRYVERKREKGIFLSVLGFGQGNYNDHMMQTLAQNGNGVAAYIDTLQEARKVLVEEASSALFPIAKDVKFQVEFNPAAVAEYRLIGYETRALKREDFNNDKIDAGDIGAGHTVTAIYEFVPVGSNARTIDPLRYGAQQERVVAPTEPANEYAFLKIRYKLPMENKSKLITTPVSINAWAAMERIECAEYEDCVQSVSNDTRFATAVAAFGQILKGGEHTGDFSYDDIISLAQSGKGADKFGYRAEFINLVRMAKSLSR